MLLVICEATLFAYIKKKKNFLKVDGRSQRLFRILDRSATVVHVNKMASGSEAFKHVGATCVASVCIR